MRDDYTPTKNHVIHDVTFPPSFCSYKTMMLAAQCAFSSSKSPLKMKQNLALIAFFTMALSFGEVQLKGCANQQGNTYCANPEESQDCPDSCCPTDRCHTLMHYVANGTFSKSLDDTTFVFFPGEHQLQQVIYIQNVSNLKFQSKQNGDRSDVTVKCNSRSQAGLDFSYISNLTIEGLKVTDCRYCIKTTYCSAVQMFRVTNLFMTSVVENPKWLE